MKKFDLSDLLQLLGSSKRNAASGRKSIRTIETEFLASAQVLWPVIVPSLLADHSIPVHMKNECLTVAVDHPIYGQQIMSEVPRLLELFREQKLPVKKIKTKQQQLQFQTGAAEKNRKRQDIMSQSSTLDKDYGSSAASQRLQGLITGLEKLE